MSYVGTSEIGRAMAPSDLQELILDIAREVGGSPDRGRVADYIPALRRADPRAFGMAVATVDGSVVGTGDWHTAFTLQSVSKVFALIRAMTVVGDDLWRHVGRKASAAFDSVAQLEARAGIPANPFVNAGALVVTDRLLARRSTALDVLLLLRDEADNPAVAFDLEVAESESAAVAVNRALGHVLIANDNCENSLEDVLADYILQCSIAMSCADLARAGLILSRHGVLRTGDCLLTPSQAKEVNSLMLTCGTYDASGEFAYRVGLPAKSGVSGGILAIVPNKYSVAVWSPGLDRHGNSEAGVAALELFTTYTGCSIF